MPWSIFACVVIGRTNGRVCRGNARGIGSWRFGSGVPEPFDANARMKGPTLAYKMIAERDNATFTSERSSAYIMLANARIWASEGWKVKITDGDGKEFGPAEFETFVSAKHRSPVREIAAALASP